MRAATVASWSLWCRLLQRQGPSAAGSCSSSLSLASATACDAVGPSALSAFNVPQRFSLLLWTCSNSSGSPAATASQHRGELLSTQLVNNTQHALLPGWTHARTWAAAASRRHGTSATPQPAPAVQGKEEKKKGMPVVKEAAHSSSSSDGSSDRSVAGGTQRSGRRSGSTAPTASALAAQDGAAGSILTAGSLQRHRLEEGTGDLQPAAKVLKRSAGVDRKSATLRKSGSQGAEHEPAASRSSVRRLQPDRPAFGDSKCRAKGRGSSTPLLGTLLKACADASSLMQLVERHHGQKAFKHIHAAAALTRFAKLAQQQQLPSAKGRAWASTLVAIARQHMATAQGRQLVNMLHAAATLQSKTQLGPTDPAFVQQLVAALRPRVLGLKPQEVSNALWALATLDATKHLELFDRLVSEAQQQLHQMTEQTLSNSLWALATLCGDQHSHSPFIQAWMREAEGRLPDFKPQELSNSLWALATLDGDQHSHGPFIQAWVREAGGRLSDFNPQNLANSLWALATLCGNRHGHSAFIHAWVRETGGRLSEFKSQNLSNSLWALATLCGDQHSHTTFIQAWVQESAGRLSDFSAQALSNSLWALAKLGHTDCAITARLLHAARARLPVFAEQALTNTAHALGTLRYQDPDFVRLLIQQARSKLPDMTSQNLANTLWAMAWLNHNDGAFVDATVKQLLQHGGGVSSQSLCNTLWALCILDHSPAAVLQPLLTEAQALLQSSHGVVLAAQIQARCQAYQYLVTMEGQGHISPQLKAQHGQLWEVCRAAWAERLQQGVKESYTQHEVLQAVRQLPGCEGAVCEQLTRDGLLSIDVAVRLPDGTKVAIEVDGKTHFMANAPDVFNGQTLWRNRMLQLRGWTVVSVPVVQWQQQLRGDADKQRAYLMQRLAQSGLQLPRRPPTPPRACLARSVLHDPSNR